MNLIFQANCYITAFLSLLFAGFIALNRKKAEKLAPVWLWSIICTVVAVWAASFALLTSANSIQHAWVYLFTTQICAILIPALFLHFVLSLLNLTEKRTKILAFNYLLAGAYVFFTLTDQMVQPLPKSPFSYYIEPKPLYHLFFVNFILSLVYAQALLVKKLWSSQGYERKQIKYLVLGSLIGFLGGSTTFLMVYDFPITPFGMYFMSLYVFIVGFAILKYQLLSLNIVIRRAVLLLLVYGLLLLGLAPILTIIHTTLMGTSSIPSLVFIIDLTFVSGVLSAGPFIYAYLVRKNRFFHENAMAGLTHELKSPLASIEGALEIINETNQSEDIDRNKLKEYLEMIKQNSDRLNNFVDDLLNVYREKEGKSRLKMMPINVSNFCQEIIDNQIGKTLTNGHDIVFKAEDPDIQAVCDTSKIGQVLSNLISNSIKFSESGEILVKAERKRNDVLISVSDRGRGIPPYDLPHIFERFYQGKNGKIAKGTGIGLTLSKFWVEAHGGKIWAESKGEGKGTRINFTLPMS